MKRTRVPLFAASLALFLITNPLISADQSDVKRIEEATAALPAYLRGEASVVMFDSDGSERVLRKGSNEFVCFRNHQAPGFKVVCMESSAYRYRGEILPIMAQTSSWSERLALIDAAIEKGSITPPTPGSRAYVLSGPDRNQAIPLLGIVLPGATAESTGLPIERSDGTWLMCPGTPGAHIMVGDVPYGRDEDIWKSCGR